MHQRDVTEAETAAIGRLVSLEAKRVIDVGCGNGRLTKFAAGRASTVYAFDPRAEDIAKARAALTDDQRTRVRFATHDAEALDLPRERFDIALCGWSL
jgi:2-polyprenyl-3-methyl-5-hydroxy-6-metoxy-1,4-benzoquinol methylase